MVDVRDAGTPQVLPKDPRSQLFGQYVQNIRE